MQIPRQQFALKNSSSECQGKSLRGFVCLVSGKLSKCGQAAISSKLGWDGKSCLERFSNHFHGSSDQGELRPPVRDLCGKPGKRGGLKVGLQQQNWGEDGPSFWRQWEGDLRTWYRLAEKQNKRCLAMPKAGVWKTGGEAPGMGQDWRCFGRGRFKGLVSACDLILLPHVL